MTRIEKFQQLKNKKTINCLFLINNLRVYKTEKLIEKMLSTNSFNVEITNDINQIVRKYNNVDLYFPEQPYTSTIIKNKNILSRLYNDKKLVIIKYSLGWNKSFTNKNILGLYPNYQNSLLNFVDSSDLTIDSHYIFSGHPWSEKLLEDVYTNPYRTKKKKILICFHWTIIISGPGKNQSVLLNLGNKILNICLKYKDQFEFIFRPHQILFNLYCGNITNKYKFGLNPDCKTLQKNLITIQNARNILFNISNHFPIIYNTDYIPWFKYSDAMIHDCGSYRCEYLYMNKPVGYFATEKNLNSTEWSEMGKDAINSHELIFNEKDFENFLLNILNEKDIKKYQRNLFYNKYIVNNPNNKSPSTNIINAILQKEEYSNISIS